MGRRKAIGPARAIDQHHDRGKHETISGCSGTGQDTGLLGALLSEGAL